MMDTYSAYLRAREVAEHLLMAHCDQRAKVPSDYHVRKAQEELVRLEVAMQMLRNVEAAE